MIKAPTPISAASTAGEGSATPRHSLGAVSGAPTKADRIRAYIAEHYPNGLQRGDAARVAHALNVYPQQVAEVKHDVTRAPRRRRGDATQPGRPGKRDAILAYIARVYPCGDLPNGALTEIGEVFDVSRERVRQIANQSGVGRTYWNPQPRPPTVCRDCDTPVASRSHRYCEEHSKVALTCDECGAEFQISRSTLTSRIRHKDRAKTITAPQFFCTRKCSGAWAGKSYALTHVSGTKKEATCESLPPASQTSSTNSTPSSEPAPVQAGSSVTPASTSGAQP